MMKITKDNVDSMLEAVKAMAAKRVLVGVPSAEAPRRGDPINNATLAYIHENGSPARNIPARPFLKPGVASAKDKLINTLRVYAKQALTDKSAIEKGLNAAGLVAQSAVKNRIRSGEGFAPLKPGTLAARRRKGAKGEKPLIRTGQLLNSITYVVRDK
jgi:phage gpG-like protein